MKVLRFSTMYISSMNGDAQEPEFFTNELQPPDIAAFRHWGHNS